MLSHLSYFLCAGVAVSAAVIGTGEQLHPQALHHRSIDAGSNTTQQLVLPMNDPNATQRAQDIQTKQQGYLYGPSLMGNSSFFPSGPLGEAMIQRDKALFKTDLDFVEAEAGRDLNVAGAALAAAGGLKNISDYALLYNNQWKESVPSGVDAGMLTNYTQDLLFSMERLSVNPYSVRRLDPSKDSLPFHVNGESVKTISGANLSTLLKSGSLFYVDYSSQKKLPRTTRYGAACEAYFYIHPVSKDFLPLAIKTNVGEDLVYTPLDAANDWLLAKMMFNNNDLFQGQGYHLVNSHAVAEIVHQAAIQTLSDDHPVLAVLNRLMYEAYAMRPSGTVTLTNVGGVFDEFFSYSGEAFAEFCSTTYYQTAGAFQANYLQKNLVARGLLNCTYGPALKSFPFLEDADLIRTHIQTFMTAFIASYYSADSQVAQDPELQAWVREASGPAQVIDFPASILTASTLVDVLTHFAYLTGVSHHVLNLGDPAVSSGLLPFHPASLYAPLPTEKGVKDLMPYLPPANQSLGQVFVFAAFNRPQFVDTNFTLSHMFSGEDLLGRVNAATVAAADAFHSAMLAVSAQFRGRAFDADGLSQGMPFVWKALDPEAVPWFFAV